MFRIPSIRVLARAPLKEIVDACLRLHLSGEGRCGVLGGTAAVAAATGTPPEALGEQAYAAVRTQSGRENGPGTNTVFADVIMWKDTAFLLHAEEAEADTTRVEVWRLHAAEGRPPPAFSDLLEHLLGRRAETHAPEGEDLKWLDRERESRLQQRLTETEVPESFREDVAQVLYADGPRRALARLRQGHALLSRPDREYDILTFAGLARKQLVLACSKEPDDALLTFDEEAQLKLLFDAKARCPRCGETFTTLNVRMLYTLTEGGSEAGMHPTWLLHPVLNALQAAGAPVRPFPVTREGNSLGGLAFCGGLAVAIAAYDRDFLPEDAVELSRTCLELQPDVVAVVTAERATPDARERLRSILATGTRARERPIRYFENFDPTHPHGVRDWWTDVADRRLQEVLASRVLAPLRAVGLDPLTLAERTVRAHREAAPRALAPDQAAIPARRPEPTPSTAAVPAPPKVKGGVQS